MFRSIMQRMDGNRRSGLELDPNVVARSFGAVSGVNEPLPETDVPLTHAEDDDLHIHLDQRAVKPQPPRSLQSLAVERLRSLKPRSPERKQQVAEALAAMLEPLKTIDDLVATLEEERFQAIDARWEEIRKQGRILQDGIPALQRELAAAMNHVNACEQEKGKCKTEVEEAFYSRKKISRFSTQKEISAADQKLESARNAMALATQDTLEAHQAMAVVEGKVATVKTNLATITKEMSRLECELDGKPYFDPTLGLSLTPGFYRDAG